MTRKEIDVKTQEKLKKIQALCEELQMTITAEEIIDGRGMIKKVVYYTDNEKYPVDKEEVTEKKVPLNPNKND